MAKLIFKNSIKFELCSYTPRKNIYEKGLKYILFVDDIPTSMHFSSIQEGRKYINDNWFIYL